MDPQDKRWKIIFDGITQESQLKSQLCFGYTIEIDDNDHEQKWPFLLEPLSGGRSARLNFGPLCEPQFEEINIFQRPISIGSLFTRGTGNDAATYRITRIERLV